MLNQLRYRTKHGLHLSAEQIWQETAAIRDVKQVDACHHREQLSEDMGRTSNACRRIVDLARIGFGVGDELRDRLGWNRWIYHHDVGATANARDRRDVADEIKIEVRIECGVDRVTRHDRHEQCVAVRWARTTTSVPILPLAPGRFSTMKCWPRRSD